MGTNQAIPTHPKTKPFATKITRAWTQASSRTPLTKPKETHSSPPHLPHSPNHNHREHYQEQMILESSPISPSRHPHYHPPRIHHHHLPPLAPDRASPSR